MRRQDSQDEAYFDYTAQPSGIKPFLDEDEHPPLRNASKRYESISSVDLNISEDGDEFELAGQMDQPNTNFLRDAGSLDDLPLIDEGNGFHHDESQIDGDGHAPIDIELLVTTATGDADADSFGENEADGKLPFGLSKL
jgi:hypothetical protein